MKYRWVYEAYDKGKRTPKHDRRGEALSEIGAFCNFMDASDRRYRFNLRAETLNSRRFIVTAPNNRRKSLGFFTITEITEENSNENHTH